MVIYLSIYFCIKQMARAKKVKSVPKTTRTRRCKTTRKRTGAAAKPKDDIENDDYEILIPKELKPKKQSLPKKALKVLLGLGGAAALGTAGYYGYKNRDKLKAKGKETMDVIANASKKFYAKNRARAAELLKKGKDKAEDAYYSAKGRLFGPYNDDKIYTNSHPAIEDEQLMTLYGPSTYSGRTPSYLSTSSTMPMRAPLAITSGLEMDVVKELTNIKDDLKRTNRINPDYLNSTLREYVRQATEKDAFIGPYLDWDMDNALRQANKIDRSSDENTIENAKNDLDSTLDTLIGKFFKIQRGGH